MDEVVEAIEKYKGLVPLVYDIETMSLVEARPQEMYYAVYLKREADKVITELESRIPVWHKCSEEMPEDGAEVLATDGDGIWLCYKTTMCNGSPWFQPDGLPHIEGVTHWMPLPKAPKEEK